MHHRKGQHGHQGVEGEVEEESKRYSDKKGGMYD